MHSRAQPAIRSRRPEHAGRHASSALIAAVSESASCDRKTRPRSESATSNDDPAPSLTTAGVPAMRASFVTAPHPSYRLGRTSRSARAMSVRTAALSRRSTRRTLSSTPWRVTAPRTSRRSGPDPTMVRWTSSSDATASTRSSGFLRSSRRPTKTASGAAVAVGSGSGAVSATE